MAAAPADFRPVEYQSQKIKKTDDGSAPTIELTTTPDVAAELGSRKRPGQVLVAFAAETQDAIEGGRRKLIRKRADLVVVNEVGPDLGFGTPDNAAWVLRADGAPDVELSRRSKEELADAVWDLVVGLWPGPPAG
jgi:phosphopantothenoylcysteine decarboxylase/phosphopantothenate--cysteine ligase